MKKIDIDKEAKMMSKRLGAKHVTIIAFYEFIIDESGKKSIKRLTFLIPAK